MCTFVVETKLGKCSVNLSVMPVYKPHKHNLYILRHCFNVVYLDTTHFLATQFVLRYCFRKYARRSVPHVLLLACL